MDIPVNISARDAINTNLNKKLDTLIIKSFGEKIKSKKDIVVYQYQSKISSIFSFGCLNEGNNPYKVVISFKNENNIYSNGSPKIEKIVQSNKYEFFTHLFPISNNNDLNSDVDFSIDYFPIK